MDMTGIITHEKLTDIGFAPPFNKYFTYRCFPAPLYGNFRIDYYGEDKNVRPIGWKIYVETGEASVYLREVQTMEQINNFYNGICDKYLF